MAIVAAVALMFHVEHCEVLNMNVKVYDSYLFWGQYLEVLNMNVKVYESLLFWGQYLEIMENPLFIFNPVLSEYVHYNPYC